MPSIVFIRTPVGTVDTEAKVASAEGEAKLPSTFAMVSDGGQDAQDRRLRKGFTTQVNHKELLTSGVVRRDELQ